MIAVFILPAFEKRYQQESCTVSPVFLTERGNKKGAAFSAARMID